MAERGIAGERPFLQFAVLRVDRSFRALPLEERRSLKEALLHALADEAVPTHTYSLVGLKAGADLLLWRMADTPDALQEAMARLLTGPMGPYLEPVHILTGVVRPSQYVRRPAPQEQAVFLSERLRYLVVYPFTKTADWYLLSRETRQGMMQEHIRVGREFPQVRQVLAYSFGLDDQEFIVAYEMDDLPVFVDLVMALRETEARRYTLRDTPLYTAIHRPPRECVDLLG